MNIVYQGYQIVVITLRTKIKLITLYNYSSIPEIELVAKHTTKKKTLINIKTRKILKTNSEPRRTQNSVE